MTIHKTNNNIKRKNLNILKYNEIIFLLIAYFVNKKQQQLK